MVLIQPVIVLYNVFAGDSISVKSMIDQGTNPIIVDNSTKDYHNCEYCDKNNMTYISMNGNAGLSKAYNRAIMNISEDTKYILWLDDDTIIPNDYIERVTKILDQNPDYTVYLPIVKSVNDDTNYLSPCLLKNMLAYKLESLEHLKNGQFSAINSGMIVKREMYKEYKYNEVLFLDCLDHDFMCDCWENNTKIMIMRSICLRQNFSGDEKSPLKNKIKRFEIFKKDFKNFRKKHRCNRLSTELYLFKRIVGIILK